VPHKVGQYSQLIPAIGIEMNSHSIDECLRPSHCTTITIDQSWSIDSLWQMEASSDLAM
jgi:hypothetical protein